MADGAGRRLGVLQRHVRQSCLDVKDDALRIIERNETSAVRSLPRFNPYVLADYMDNMGDLKRELYSLFQSKPELLPPVIEGMTKEKHRQLVGKQLRALLDAGYSPLHYLHKDQRRYFYIAEIGALVDLSLCIKMGVQFSLWGGSILNLGTESHHERFFDDIATYRLPGCFLMTELKHGSNVAGLQTEAVLDVVTDEWVINTPDDGAIKWWIGNAAEDGKAGTVFARLKLPKQDGSGGLQDYGVHAFVVPLRDMATSQLLPGVEIHDCGYKVGLNGVDNGAVRFTNVRIPRSNLLDRFASVDRSGQYRSGELSATKRFAVTLGELTGGRVGLVCSSVGVLKGALTIAVRYSAQRQQFGPEDGPEISILDYPSQQAKLMPMLATCYALHFAREFLVDLYCRVKQSRSPQLMADLHALSAGLKAYTTHEVAECLSVCRESCGGHGYAAVNRLGAWRSDHDIFQTFEGDNTVLLQQVSAHLLKQHRQKFAGSPLNATYAYLRQLMRDNLPQNPFVTHDTDTNHLRDPTWLSHALKYRVARLLHTVAVRLSRHTAQMGSFRAWNRCLLHLLALARAHLELVIYQRFIHAVNLCDDADSRPALKALCDLFALQRIHSEALYRDEDFMSPTKAVAIQRLIAKLCGELRGVAVPLVDAFAIPDHILRAPIGTSSFSSGADHDVYDTYLATAGFEAHDSQHP